MKAYYELSFAHFNIVDGIAKASPRETKLRDLSSLEVLQIMMIFQDISPIQHFDGEPTITIITRQGSRHLVRTDLNKLILSDPRDPMAPSRVLEAASILLEIEDADGDVRRNIRHTLTDIAYQQGTIPSKTEEQNAPHLRERLGLGALLAGFGIFAAAWCLHEIDSPAQSQLTPIEQSAEVLKLKESLLGTYMTGTGPGDYAIIVRDPERLVFMELGHTPPAEIRTPYTLAYQNDRLCIVAPGFQPILTGERSLSMGNLLFIRQ